jgi:hypothetical protein
MGVSHAFKQMGKEWKTKRVSQKGKKQKDIEIQKQKGEKRDKFLLQFTDVLKDDLELRAFQ